MELINDIFFKKINSEFELTKLDIGQDSLMKKKGMKFQIEVYEVKNIGQLFLMKMNAMFGLMKMETVVFSVNNRDVPLFNMDYIKAFGKETFIMELYNFMLNPYKEEYLEEFSKAKEKDNDIENYTTEPKWYDKYHFEETYMKTGKKLNNRFRITANNYIDILVKQIKDLDPCDNKLKQEKIKEFADTLYEKGGPAVNSFKDLFGLEKTKKVVCEYMYGGTKVNKNSLYE